MSSLWWRTVAAQKLGIKGKMTSKVLSFPLISSRNAGNQLHPSRGEDPGFWRLEDPGEAAPPPVPDWPPRGPHRGSAATTRAWLRVGF